MSGIQLETERLILRVPRIEDFERYAGFFGDESSRTIGGPHPRGDAWRRFLQMPGAWLVQGFGMFSVIEKSSGLWVGQAGPWRPDGWPGTEVGYAFHQDARGKGYCTEACVAAIDFAFDALGWEDVIHCIDEKNIASQNVARRLGSRNRGRGALPKPLDVHAIDIWGQTRDEWRIHRSRFA
ncbi:MAG: GNAT family N-acetyltransferase [Pseudomonadota bacterium]